MQSKIGGSLMPVIFRCFSTTSKATSSLENIISNFIPKHSYLRRKQMAAIEAALEGYSVFVQFPTGWGKSLTYQVPAILTPGVTFVISPLVALSWDQKNNLKKISLPNFQVATWTSQETPAIKKKLLDSVTDAAHAKTSFLIYTTPESWVLNSQLRNMVAALNSKNRLNRFVLDECQCVLEWMRPEFIKMIKMMISEYPKIPMTLSSASTTTNDRKTLIQLCDLNLLKTKSLTDTNRERKLILITEMYDRENLKLFVWKKSFKAKRMAFLAETLKSAAGPAIVYSLTQLETERTAKELSHYDCFANVYHAGLSPSERNRNQREWMSGKVKVICATVAFGMGIDMPNVRYVVHTSLPLSISQYYQQIGRAGRDNKASQCILFYSKRDILRAKNLLESGDDSVLSTRAQGDFHEMISFCETAGCRREILLSHIDESKFTSNLCHKNCNCGSLASPEYDTIIPAKVLRSIQQKNDQENQFDDFGNEREIRGRLKPSKGFRNNKKESIDHIQGTVEVLHARIQSEAKRFATENSIKYSKQRHSISRATIKEMLLKQPDDVFEMSKLKNMDDERAQRFFNIIETEYAVVRRGGIRD